MSLAEAKPTTTPERLPPFRCRECMRGPDKVEFPKDTDGSHVRICVECRHRLTLEKRFKGQEQSQQRDALKLLRMAARQKVHLPPLNEAVRMLVGKYGNLETVIDIIYVKLNHLLLKDDNKFEEVPAKITLDALKFLVGFIKAGLPQVETTIDASSMSEEEMDEALQTFFAEAVAKALPPANQTEPLTCQHQPPD